MTGFLEESPGVRSSARLAALAAIGACCLLTLAVAFAIIYVTIHPKDRESIAGLFGTTAAIIGALGGTAWGALRERTPATEPAA